MRHPSWALATAQVAVASAPASAQLRNLIPGCTILTPADLDAAKIDFIIETSCTSELYQSAVMITDRGGGAVMVIIGTATGVLGAYNQDVAGYKQIGPNALKEENAFGERSYFADTGDGDFIIGFVKGAHYFRYLGGGESAEARKVSETIGRTLATRFASRP